MEPDDVIHFPHRENVADDREDNPPVTQPGNLKVTEPDDDPASIDQTEAYQADAALTAMDEDQASRAERAESEDTTPQYVVDDEDNPNPHWF
jgi:hypothetical protein